ncbi:MAG: PorT family protein [Calditrichaeota bacterium]|nr:MAG: PorT family protein [Calditrichota bacterium]
MTKATFALLLFLAIFSEIAAQPIIGFGIKAGGTRAKQIWKWDQVYDFQKKPRIGMAVGTFVELRALPLLSASLEAFYIQKGFEETILYSNKFTKEEKTYNPRLDYLSFFLLAKFALSKGIETYFLFGPHVDIEIVNDNVSVYNQIYDNLQGIDIGATLGLGIKSPEIYATNLLLELRYSPSARNIFDEKILDEDITVRNQSIEFLMGFEF